MRHNTLRSRFPGAPKRGHSVRGDAGALPEQKAPRVAGPCRAARMLALAHHVDRLVDAGDLTSYAAAGRLLGLTRARMTQIENLTLLAPEIQAQLVAGVTDISERRLRRVVQKADWQSQIAMLQHECQDSRLDQD